jgi:hypothetical protein
MNPLFRPIEAVHTDPFNPSRVVLRRAGGRRGDPAGPPPHLTPQGRQHLTPPNPAATTKLASNSQPARLPILLPLTVS